MEVFRTYPLEVGPLGKMKDYQIVQYENMEVVAFEINKENRDELPTNPKYLGLMKDILNEEVWNQIQDQLEFN